MISKGFKITGNGFTIDNGISITQDDVYISISDSDVSDNNVPRDIFFSAFSDIEQKNSINLDGDLTKVTLPPPTTFEEWTQPTILEMLNSILALFVAKNPQWDGNVELFFNTY